MFLVINVWKKIICCYYHPILDVSCRQFLDENYALNYHLILDVSCHQCLDENYMLLLSSNIGCLLSSIFGWKLCAAIIIQNWMVFIVSLWRTIIQIFFPTT